MIVPRSTDPLASAIQADAPEHLARTLYPHALLFARRVLGGGDPHLVTTAAHDAILDVVRYRHTFRGDSRASTWLFTITRRAVIRCAKREARQSSDESSLSVGSVSREAEARAAETLDPIAVVTAKSHLVATVPNPRWRTVWLLHNDPGGAASIEEIAARLGYTPGTVAVILSHVRGLIAAREE